MGWIKKIVLNTALIAVSVLAVVGATEIALRFTSLQGLLPYRGMPEDYYELRADTGYDIARNVATSTHRFSDGTYDIWSNELGCFDMPYSGETPYIYLAGDSFTWGFAPFEDKWGTQLQERIGVRTVKCGVPGYGTKQELVKAENLLADMQPPQLIVLTHFSNDVYDDKSFPNSVAVDGVLLKNDIGLPLEVSEEKLREVKRWGEVYCTWYYPENPALQRVKCFLSKHSILYHLFKNTVKNALPGEFLEQVGVVNESIGGGEVQDADYEKHFGHILEFTNLAERLGARLLVVLAPGKDETRDGTSKDHEKVRGFLAAHTEITWFDLTPHFHQAAAEGQQLFWEKDGHWNVAGNHLAGELVADYIKGQGLLGTQ